MVFIVYNISNGLARTSGGRYIVPIDWIVALYYFIGIFYIIVWLGKAMRVQWNVSFRNPEPDLSKSKTPNQFSKSMFVFAVLLGFGSLIPLSENLYQPRYRNTDPMETLVVKNLLIKDAGLNIDDIQKFLQSPNASIITGRVLYPRYMELNQGEFANAFYPYNKLNFPRMAFIVAGPAGNQPVVLPGDVPNFFPHASDVLVLGCKGQNYLDALVVLVMDKKGTVYTRNPGSELQCPLREPVCTSDSVCQ